MHVLYSCRSIFGGVVQQGDLVVFTYGDVVGLGGSTNSLKIVKVGERRTAR